MTSLQEFIEQQKQQREEASRRRQERKPERKVQVATFKSSVFTSVSGTATDQYINYAPDATNTPVNTYDALSQSGSALEFTAPLSRFYDYTSRVYLSALNDPSDLTDDDTTQEAQLAADFLVKVYKVDLSGSETLLTTGRSTTDGAALVGYPSLAKASRLDNLQASDFTGVVYMEAGEKLRVKLDYSLNTYAQRISIIGVDLVPFGFCAIPSIDNIIGKAFIQGTNAAAGTYTACSPPPSGGTKTNDVWLYDYVMQFGGSEGFSATPTSNTFTGDFDFFMRINEIGADY